MRLLKLHAFESDDTYEGAEKPIFINNVNKMVLEILLTTAERKIMCT